MDDNLMEKVMEEVMKKMGETKGSKKEAPKNDFNPGITEFVGTAIGDTIGLVIANVDHNLHGFMKIDPKFKSIGIIGARTGAGPHIMAADEAVKATNVEIISIELPRDTKGGAGHGCLILFGAEDVSDARRAVEVTLKELDRTFGDVYANGAGHIELQYTARASYACNKAFNAPVGKAFGLIVGAPAAIGVVIADAAVKAANVDIVAYASPSTTSFTNESILFISGDSGAVRQAVVAARDLGIRLLEALGKENAPSVTTPYI
ncbi:MAG TPA: propanediol utilization microcompartment protein PduB, partial [Proteiniclasticum sp.]|nr:propanediol utilization microcompartment protein PduB [Proteiniclasticum sp.]